MPTQDFSEPSATKGSIDSNELKTKPLTFAQQLVGLTFNPSGDDKVDKAKALCAELAELVMNDLAPDAKPSYLYILVKGKALGEVLGAQMMVVKLLTLKY